MAQNGVKTPDLTPVPTLDDVLGNQSGSTVRAPIDSFATQLVSSGPLADRINNLDAQVASTFRPEDFGAVGDYILSDGSVNPSPTDDIAAFQLMSNAIYERGGGRVILKARGYFLKTYTGADVGGKICWNVVSDATVSNVWLIPGNTTIVGAGHCVIAVDNAGSSSPFGYSLSANILVFSGERGGTAVSSVTNSSRSCVVASTSDLSVGQSVWLGRDGGNDGSGNPYTPSQEVAPVQFLTIASITGTTVTFEESFLHNFEAVTDRLFVRWPREIEDWTRNVFIEGIEFRGIDSGNGYPYMLLSNVVNTGVDRCNLKSFNGSWGTSQTVRIGSVIQDCTGDAKWTIESVSDVKVGSWVADGRGEALSIGSLFLSDNCRDVHIGNFEAMNCVNIGFAALYSIEGRCDRMVLRNCGTGSTYDGLGGALSLGMPLKGFYPTKASAELDAYKTRNLGQSRFTIGDLKILGDGIAVPVRFADGTLVVDSAKIDFDASSGSTAPFVLGESGAATADATYFPNGGTTSLQVARLDVNVTAGAYTSPAFWVNGRNGVMGKGVTTFASAASASDTTITVADGTKIRNGSVIYFCSTGQTSTAPGFHTVSGVSGNAVTLSSSLSDAVDAGAEIWSIERDTLHDRDVFIRNITVDGGRKPDVVRKITLWPDYATGAGPYTDTVDIDVPDYGEWVLEVRNVSTDTLHREVKTYHVTYWADSAGYEAQVITQISANKLRVNSTVVSASISGGTVTVTLGSSTSGKSSTVTFIWTAKG